MDAKILNSLQPADLSSPSLRAALEKTRSVTAATQKRLADDLARFETEKLSLNSKQRRETLDALDDLRLDLDQLESLATSLQDRLSEAEQSEALELARSNRALLMAKIADHEATFLSEYRIHENAIRALLIDRKALADALAAHNESAKAFPKTMIADKDELYSAIRQTSFYRTPLELKAAEAEAEAQRMSEYYDRVQAEQKRRDALLEQFAARQHEQLPPVVSIVS